MHIKIHIADFIFGGGIGALTWWYNGYQFGGIVWAGLISYGVGRLSQYIQMDAAR